MAYKNYEKREKERILREAEFVEFVFVFNVCLLSKHQSVIF